MVPKQIKIILFFFIFIIAMSSFAIAKPVISDVSGDFSHFNFVKIYGENFGEKETPKPIRYDDCEGLTVGSSIADQTEFWTDRASDYSQATISDINQRGVSEKNIRAQNDVYGNPLFFSNNVGFADTGKIFVSFWVRWDWGSNIVEAGDGRYQIKLFRTAVEIEGNGKVIDPDFANFNWWYEDISNKHYITNQRDVGSNTQYFDSGILVDDSWHHMMLQADMGSAGNSDGKWKAWCSKEGFSAAYNLIIQENTLVIGSTDNLMNAVKFDCWLGNLDSGDLDLFLDDIYIDNSWARVEIGSHPNYEDCKHREIQLPKEWSDEQIEIYVNQGGFSSGDDVFLFVVDGSGNISKGFPLNIGDQKEEDLLTPPSNPEVISSE